MCVFRNNSLFLRALPLRLLRKFHVENTVPQKSPASRNSYICSIVSMKDIADTVNDVCMVRQCNQRLERRNNNCDVTVATLPNTTVVV